MPLELRRETQGAFPVATEIFEFLSISRGVRHHLLLKHALPIRLEISKGCEASCGDEVGK